MTLTEKAAYLRGLAAGLNLDAEKPETKLFHAIMDVIDDLALTDLEDNVALINEQLDAVDEDLDALENYVYDEMDDEDEIFDDEDVYEVECPNCKEIICVDGDILDEGSINCPNCNELLEFDVEEDEDNGEDE